MIDNNNREIDHGTALSLVDRTMRIQKQLDQQRKAGLASFATDFLAARN
jgi:hypothetical protein